MCIRDRDQLRKTGTDDHQRDHQMCIRDRGDTVKPRLMEAEADLERVLVIDDRDTPLTLADERIARAIRENNARLVIIDPVQAFLGADVDLSLIHI